MQSVHGVAQHYAWGDTDAIPELLGLQPDGTPWAEWWLGTHPAAPSTLDGGEPLSSVSGQLPYLLKLLAAAEPLSLQTHPDMATAAAGFALGLLSPFIDQGHGEAQIGGHLLGAGGFEHLPQELIGLHGPGVYRPSSIPESPVSQFR